MAMYDWFVCSPCCLGFPAFDERGLLEKFLNVTGPMAACPECGELVESTSTVTYGRPDPKWEHGEG